MIARSWRGATHARDAEAYLAYSLWDSTEAIRQFAGDDIEKAVFYPEDERFLLERDEQVSHYEVVFDHREKP